MLCTSQTQSTIKNTYLLYNKVHNFLFTKKKNTIGDFKLSQLKELFPQTQNAMMIFTKYYGETSYTHLLRKEERVCTPYNNQNHTKIVDFYLYHLLNVYHLNAHKVLMFINLFCFF